MPITSESQRNRVALLIALNVLILVAYAVYVLASVSTPSPLLVSVLIAGLGYNLAELWLSTPYREGPRRTTQRARTIPRATTRSLPSQVGSVVLGRTTPSAVASKRGLSERASLAERLGTLEEAKLAGRRIDPDLTPIEETILGAESAQTDLTREAQESNPMDTALLPADATMSVTDPLQSGQLEQTVSVPEVDAEVLPPVGDAELPEVAVSGLDEAIETARSLVNAFRSTEEIPHSELSALAVDIVEAEIQTEAPIADVGELENILEAVEAEGEAAATMDALEQLGPVLLTEAKTVAVMEPAIPEVTAELLAEPLAEPLVGQQENRPEESVALTELSHLTDVLPAEIHVAVDLPAFADPAATPELPQKGIVGGMAATEAPTSIVEISEDLPADLQVAKEDEFVVVAEATLDAPATIVPQDQVATETAAAVTATANESSAAALATIAANRVIGLGADLIGEGDVPELNSVAIRAKGEAADDRTKPDVEPRTTLPSSVSHLGGRVRDPVDIVIATLQTEPVRKPAAAAGRRRAGISTASVPVPPRAATGLRASDETLAMLRNQLGVGLGIGKDAENEALRRTREEASAGIAREPSAESTVAQPSAPASKAPLEAPKRPAPQVSDNARDRVMFVWHGRHFLAPMEGRHPLRVAQSLYDFMVEEATERA